MGWPNGENGEKRNTFSGAAYKSNVVQVGTVHGDVTIGGTAVAEPLDRAQEILASAIREQWKLEAALRSLHQPQPLRLRWSATHFSMAGSKSGASVDEIIEVFRGAQHRRLIILGEPGSGKTSLALLFTLGLLAKRIPGDPVPVLLTLSSWNPQIEHLHTWTMRRLEEDYKVLADHRVCGRDAALRLLRTGRVFPILDGLDELPASLHTTAIERINNTLASGSEMAMVVTCRRQEYEAAVMIGEAELSAASIVDLAQVDVDDAIEFLSVPTAALARWEPVFEHLRQYPDSPLAVALSTPLMVYLARVAYCNPASDPAEMTQRSWFDSSDAIERHLLAAFVPAVYNEHPPSPALVESSVGKLHHYSRVKVLRWLSFLASDVEWRGDKIAWWDAPGSSSRTGQSAGSQFGRAMQTLCGRLPWRLTRFLEDAHRRGVLRRAGPIYQFRHARLRDCIADLPEANRLSIREIAIWLLMISIFLLVAIFSIWLAILGLQAPPPPPPNTTA